jgi:RimJ/RimL family protein N-acetyltransferase
VVLQLLDLRRPARDLSGGPVRAAEARGSGAGKALLANLAKRCVDENLGRLEWAVLDWNAPSIAFYDSLGAAAMDEWIVRRMTWRGAGEAGGGNSWRDGGRRS